MEKHLIFVSCGQVTEAEKTLGVLVKTAIESIPGFEAYFAETVQDLESLGRHVLDGLQRCSGAVVILQDRGVVVHADGTEWGHRSSVWVNQEIAILAYRQFFEAKPIPIIAFSDGNVRLEGAMTSLIVNPRPLGSVQDTVAAVKSWLSEEQFGDGHDDAFVAKWTRLSDTARRVLVCLIAQGGHQVKVTAVRRCLIEKFQMDSNGASDAVREARGQFIDTDLVQVTSNSYSGNELSLHETWEFRTKRQVAEWFAENPVRE